VVVVLVVLVLVVLVLVVLLVLLVVLMAAELKFVAVWLDEDESVWLAGAAVANVDLASPVSFKPPLHLENEYI
jgi:hypothetical protein